MNLDEAEGRLGEGRDAPTAQRHTHDIPDHSHRPATPPSQALLADLYIAHGLDINEIAVHVDRTPQHIGRLLARYNIALRPRQRPAPKISKPELVDLYVNQRLTATAVGARLGCSGDTVLTALRFYEIEPRPPGPPRRRGGRVPFDADTVIELYVEHELSTVTIANQGCW